MLDPEFFTDPDIVANLDAFGRLFYQGLWCVANDSGCFENNALLLKMKIFPGDNIDIEQIEGYVQQLVDMGKVVTYEAEGKECGWLKNFHKHQTLQKPSPPTVPLPEWIVWHGEDEYGDQRHKYYYEIVENGSGDSMETEEEPVQDTSKTEDGQRKDADNTSPAQKRSRSEKKRSEHEMNEKGKEECEKERETATPNPAQEKSHATSSMPTPSESKTLKDHDREKVRKVAHAMQECLGGINAKRLNELMDVYHEQQGMEAAVLVEALRRTLHHADNPNYSYTLGILDRWRDQNVQSMADVEALDEKWRQKKNGKGRDSPLEPKVIKASEEDLAEADRELEEALASLSPEERASLVGDDTMAVAGGKS